MTQTYLSRLATAAPLPHAKRPPHGRLCSNALTVHVEFGRFDVRVQNRSEFLFHSKRGTPLLSSNVLSEALHPALKALRFPKTGMHSFRRGCNVRWELSGMNGAVLRQMMGHSGPSMTARYSGQLSVEQIRADFSRRNGPKIVVSENSENASAVQAIA